MTERKRILVTGSRGWTDRLLVADSLVRAVQWLIAQEPELAHVPAREWVTLVHGDCPEGADRLAAAFARMVDWEVEPHPADWRPNGKYDAGAGPRRNAEMVSAGADFCVAFAGDCAKYQHKDDPPHMSHGTEHCANLARAAGIPTRYIWPGGQVTSTPESPR